MKARKLFLTVLFLLCYFTVHASIILTYINPQPLAIPIGIPTDSFDDNSRGALWTLVEEDAVNCHLSEANQRLEVLSSGGGSGKITAAYVSRFWALNVTADFLVRVSYHCSIAAGTDGGVLFGLMRNRGDFSQQVSFQAGYEGTAYLCYRLDDVSGSESDTVERIADDGVLYISYSAATDTLYLSDRGYGSENAWKSISGLLQGDWGGGPVFVALGGMANGAVLASGDAYLDDFLIESCTLREVPLLVTSPVRNELLARGQTYPIEWETDNLSPNVKILLFKGATRVASLTAGTPNDGSWNWTVPADLSLGTDYRIRINCAEDTSVSAFSEMFEICRPGDLYTPIEVTDPNAASVWQEGTQYAIQWTGGAPGTAVAVKLFNANTAVMTIQTSTPNDGQFLWTPPYTLAAGTDYRVRVISKDYNYVADSSDSFEIAIPPFQVSQPNGGESWKSAAKYQVQWVPGSAENHVKIQLLDALGTVQNTLVASTPDDGGWTWSIPSTLLLGQYKIRVTSIETPARQDESDAVFEVVYNYNRKSYMAEEFRRYDVPGEHWEYSSFVAVNLTTNGDSESYSGTYNVAVDVLPNQTIGGHLCSVVRSICDDDTTQMAWYTDASGLHMQQWMMDSDVGRMTLDMKSVVVAPKLMTVGTVYSNSGPISGTFRMNLDGEILNCTISGRSNVSMQLMGWQDVTVPYGTYKAMKMKSTVSIQNANFTIRYGGESVTLRFSVSSTDTVWGAPNVGLVKTTSVATQRFTDGVDTIDVRATSNARLTDH